MKKLLTELEYEFDAEKNQPLVFLELTSGRRKPVIWTCQKCGHSWVATVSNRLKGTECPRCQGKIPIPGETDLETSFPVVAMEWDYSLNAKGPDKYLPYSNQRVAWICNAGHRWEETINNRTRKGLLCPYCGGSRPIPGVNDLGTLYPWLEKQWDQKANGDLKPSNVFPQSNRRVGWICERGHKWESKIYHRTDGQGCPYCEGLKPILGETDLETIEPSAARQWIPEKNGGRLPSEFTRFSHFNAMWICDQGHEYAAPIYRRSRGCGCPICDGKRIIPGTNDLRTRAPRLAREWDNKGNGDVTPDKVALHSNTQYSWCCSKCGHVWKATPNNRAAGRGCPKCAGHCVEPQVNSFAAINPQMIGEWDIEKNWPLTAWDVAAYDNRDHHWVCKQGHSFSASPANRTKGTKCPYCTGKLPIVGVNDFGTICSTVAAEWHPTKNENLLPEHYLPNSHQEAWWKCKEGHEWRASIESRTRGAQCKECSKRRTKHSYLI